MVENALSPASVTVMILPVSLLVSAYGCQREPGSHGSRADQPGGHEPCFNRGFV